MVAVGERLRGRDDDGVARVDTHGVEVLHVADRDARVRPVAHDFVLDLLPAPQRPLDEDLVDGRRGEPTRADALEVVVRGDEPTARASERVRGADDEREAVDRGEVPNLFERLADVRDRDGLADRLQHLLEGLAILRLADRVYGGAEEPDPVALQNAGFREIGGEVEAGLPT